ncbi:glutathione S-transferase family protein [Parathalassolituus penaei]|uniref:glutathione transferase n=1 Tax=Parathalassolituus penaei TaxID=2997323 RepID=A0A9X3EGI0_9GAMM|nr:glutathione S-transferase [Parathalassolituus penaei]MCY0967094.1 glutathione S-transferase [Parathalassolituus penaei]
MIRLHHLNSSRSQRILWMLEELDVPYELVEYQRDSQTLLAPAALKQVHPLGKAPVLEDGERVLAESGLIIEYLGQRYGQGRFCPPADSDEYWTCRYWLHYAEGSLMPFLLLALVMKKMSEAPMPFFIRPVAKTLAGKVVENFVQPNIRRHLGWVEQHLTNRSWFAGDAPTLADFQMSFPLDAALQRAASADDYPAIAGWLRRVHARPAWQRAESRGGAFKVL